MSTIAIRAENLGKRYRIGVPPEKTRKLGRRLLNLATGSFQYLTSVLRQPRPEEVFWALKDVSFEVNHGEVLGIIGRNGAGKSTLLKILSRITEPTAGRAELFGRVAGLLEVGTGFHPQLTGRENIYLNGALLGMQRAEINRKFDDIVDFSEVSKFLDTPVKRYSSGMYVRLAFAVAAHLEPEILIVDEVLAVGDAAFQKKCIGKIGKVAKEGRTVLFVSHTMTAISGLCNRVIVLENGLAVFDGPTRAGIDLYMNTFSQSRGGDLRNAHRWGPGRYARLQSIALFNEAGLPCDTISMGDTIVVELEVACTQRLGLPEIGIALENSTGIGLHVFISNWEGWQEPLPVGLHRFRVQIPKLSVYPGTYALTPWVKRQGESADDGVDRAMVFTVLGADLTGHGPYFERYTQTNCEVYWPSTWSHTAGTETAQMDHGQKEKLP